MRRAPFVVLACVGLFAAGCGGGGGQGPSEETGTYVGKVSGTKAYAAVVAGSGTSVGFVTNSRVGVGEPFGGMRRGDRIRLKSKKGPRLDVKLTEDGATGTLAVRGKKYRVPLEAAGRHAGLYRSAGTLGGRPVWAVWIVLNDGRQKGTASNGKRVAEPPRIDTKTETIIGPKKNGKRQKVAKVEPGDHGGPGPKSPAAAGIFKGGNGFQGGQGGQ